MVAKCFKKILLLLFITGAIQANAQEGKKSELQQWKDFGTLANFRGIM